jgi:hypothetical protein
VPNFSRMVAILVRHRVPILDNGGTGLMDLGSDVDHCGILTAIVQVAIPDGMGL